MIRHTERALPIALLRAREAVMRRFRPMLAEHGITEQQWRVLRVLAEAGTLSPTDLAERSCILMPSLSRILRTLDGRGLVERRANQEDGRSALLAVSTSGQQLITSVAPDSDRIYAALIDEFGEERAEQLLDLLADLARL